MPETMLTDEEHALLAKISEVSEGFSQLIRPGDHHISACDWDEVAAAIHTLPNRLHLNPRIISAYGILRQDIVCFVCLRLVYSPSVRQ